MPRTLTVLAPIRRGEEDALRALLRPIGDDIRGQRPFRRSIAPESSSPAASESISRASRSSPTPIADPIRRLFYSANYDGDLPATSPS